MILFLLIFGLLGIALPFATTTSAAQSGSGYVALTDVVKDFFSKEILFEAQPRCRFLQFAKQKMDLTVSPGGAISFVKYTNLSGGGSVDEATDIGTVGLATSTIRVPVSEHGNAIEITELLSRTSYLNVMGDASKLLANNLAIVLDKQLRDACYLSTNIIYGGSLGTEAGLDNSASGLTVAKIRQATEFLATKNAPKFENEYYVCIAHPHQIAQLKGSSEWLDVVKYAGSRRQIYLGEVGMFDGVIFIETTNIANWNASSTPTKASRYPAATGATNLWEAIIFGENAYAWAVALEVEFREDPVKDLGRKRRVGWYGIWGSKIIEGNNLVRLVTG